MLEYVFVFASIFVLLLLYLNEKARDYVANTIISLISSFSINYNFSIFSDFINYIIVNQVGQLWLFSYFAILLVIAYNVIIYNRVIR